MHEKLISFDCVQGGGERVVLESRACGTAVLVEPDNPKLSELLELPLENYSLEAYARGIATVVHSISALGRPRSVLCPPLADELNVGFPLHLLSPGARDDHVLGPGAAERLALAGAVMLAWGWLRHGQRAIVTALRLSPGHKGA